MPAKVHAHQLCVTCGFGVPANQWRAHRRRCFYRVPVGARCSFCRDFIPCRKRGCPHKDMPNDLPDDEEPGTVPRTGVVKSLGMLVTKTEDGRWAIRARWLDGPVFGDTWPEAYWKAIGAK